MFVFLFVTGVTISCGILETGCQVTALAGGHKMPPRQGKARQGVVKLADLPGAVVVA